MIDRTKLTGKRVLIVEDSESFRKVIFEELSASGFNAAAAENGKEALEMYKKEQFPVVLTDIEMPVMDGIELIGHLKNLEIEPVILVITSHFKPEMIIDIMKQGVFDYIIKPPNKKELKLKVSRAFDTFEMNRMKLISEKEKVIRLEQQLEWYKWLERTEKKGALDADEQFFDNLTRSFNQGAGFGALLTLLDIIKGSAKEDGDRYS